MFRCLLGLLLVDSLAVYAVVLFTSRFVECVVGCYANLLFVFVLGGGLFVFVCGFTGYLCLLTVLFV